MRKVLLISIFFSTCLISVSQDLEFSPAPLTDTIPSIILSDINSRLKTEKKRILSEDLPKRNFVVAIYEKQSESLIKYFNEDYFITEGTLKEYLDKVLGRIYDSNPSLARTVNVYPFRSSLPNALTFWDGTVGITLGLLAKMETEDQLAFVIGHEMAHHYSNHHKIDIERFAKANFDPMLEKQIRSIKAGQYGSYSKLKDLFQNIGLGFNRHSRLHEFEADSLGLIYSLRARYTDKGAFRVMEILDSVEVMNYKTNFNLSKVFNFEKGPFKKTWLKYNPSSMTHKNPDDEFGESDTLKTHPDCKKRLQHLKNISSQLLDNRKGDLDSQLMKYFALNSNLDMIESDFHFKKYGKSLFESLNLLEKYPNLVYLNAMVAKNLFWIYRAQKDHRMSKSVPLPNPWYPYNYNIFLAFFHNLRLAEMANIAYQYVVSKPEKMFDNEDFIYSFWLVSHLPGSETSPSLIRDAYLEKFRDGRYRFKIKLKL